MAANHDLYDYASAQGPSPYPELDEETIKTLWDVCRDYPLAFKLVQAMRFGLSRNGQHWWQHLPHERWIAPLGEFTNFTHVKKLEAFLADPHEGLPAGNLRLATDAIDATEPEVFGQYEHFGWFQSPVCRTQPSIEELYASLTKKRRDRLKNTIKRSALNPGCVFIFDNPEQYLDLMYTWLRARWPDDDDFAFALLQLAWSLAVNRTKPHLMRWTGHFTQPAVPDAVAYFQIQPGGGVHKLATFQGIVSPDAQAGAVMLAASSVQLHHGHIDILDPTCRTIFTEHSSDIYKRAIINEDRLRPTLYAARGKVSRKIQPPYWQSGEWVLPEQRTILFEGI